MTKTIVPGLFAISAALFCAGCSHLDLTPPGPADRVLTGEVTASGAGELPPGTEVIVRVMDLSKGEDQAEVLGEQTIKDPGSLPVPFRIEYRAEDDVLRRSVEVDARISVGGRLRYLSTYRNPVTLSNVNDPHVVQVELASRR